jgi:hypothetical protein
MLLRGIPLVLFLVRMWRKLPASQKRYALQVIGRYGPLVLAAGARQARKRRQQQPSR